MKYKKYDKFEGMMKALVDEFSEFHWLNKGGIYKINPDKVERIDEKNFYRGLEYQETFIDEAVSLSEKDLAVVYDYFTKNLKLNNTMKKDKKAKKLTPEQKLKQENAQLSERVEELKGRESYLEEKIKSRDERIEKLGEEMNQNAELYQERESQNRREVERLMEIIRWQIKPEAALQKSEKKITGDRMFPLGHIGCGA